MIALWFVVTPKSAKWLIFVISFALGWSLAREWRLGDRPFLSSLAGFGLFGSLWIDERLPRWAAALALGLGISLMQGFPVGIIGMPLAICMIVIGEPAHDHWPARDPG